MRTRRQGPTAPTKRTLAVALVTALAAATTLVACGTQEEQGRSAAAPKASAAAGADWTPVAGLPLTSPKQIYSRNGVLRVTLEAKRGAVEVSGAQVTAQSFNGNLVGPTLHVRPGDTLDVTFKNQTDQDTNIHYHGLHVRPTGISDNVFRIFTPGRTVRSIVKLPADHATGTLWYHAHLHGLTEGQVMGGMSGLLIVEGLNRLLPRPLRRITERQLAIRNVQTIGDAVVDEGRNVSGQTPGPLTINGLLMPRFSIRSGETQLWRLANIGPDIFYDVALPGTKFTVVAEDGTPVWSTFKTDHLVLDPGKRYDVLVQGGRPGTYTLETRKYGGGFNRPRRDLATVTVTGPQAPRSAYARLPKSIDTPSTPIGRMPVARRRKFVFTFGTSRTGGFEALINNKMFRDGVNNVVPILGTVEEWKLINRSDEEHPFHIHVNDFQVMSVNGKPYHARGLQDIVTIPVGGNVVIRNPFRDFTGHFVFHCHILGHEDAGMMQTVDVIRRGERPTPPPLMHGGHDGMEGMDGM